MRLPWSEILPTRCHGCGARLRYERLPGLRLPLLCRRCRGRLRSWPEEETLEPGLVLLSAHEAGPLLLGLVKAWKYGGDDAAVPLLARAMARRLERARLPGPLILVPVPLSPLRRLRRGFNQSWMLALQVSRITGLARPSRLLARRWGAGRQAGRDRNQRLARAGSEFRARRPAPGEGSLVLVDDLCTTGATLRACRRALDPEGTRPVWALAAGRVPRIAP